VHFHNVISLPPDEYNKMYSDEELKCSVPKVNVNGVNRHFPKVLENPKLEVDVVYEEELVCISHVLGTILDGNYRGNISLPW
jgi:hypothetical protein